MDVQSIVTTVTALGVTAAMFSRYVILTLQLKFNTHPWLGGLLAIFLGMTFAAGLTAIKGEAWTWATDWTVILAGVVAAPISLGLQTMQAKVTERAVQQAKLER